MLHKYFPFLGKRLYLSKFSQRFKKEKKKERLLHKMKRSFLLDQSLRYFFFLCLPKFLEFFKNDESIFLLKSFFFSPFTLNSKVSRCPNNFFYFFLGFFSFFKFNSSFKLDKKIFKRSIFKLLLRRSEERRVGKEC